MGARQWVGEEDRERVPAHLSASCAYVEADQWHKAPSKHFQNLVLTGRIEVASPDGTQRITRSTFLHRSDMRGMTLLLTTPRRKSGTNGRHVGWPHTADAIEVSRVNPSGRPWEPP